MADTYWDLFWGYSAIWVLVILYLIRLGCEQRQIAKRVLQIEHNLGRDNGEKSCP